jgi:N4-gp56 family major capsid protein
MYPFNNPFVIAYVNTLDAWVPELWAQESLIILEENMVITHLVHRDFENLVARFGDTVNTRRPGKFSAARKDVNDDVTIQDASATNIAVKLDQHFHTSFMIRDGEEAKSFATLVEEYLREAVSSIARKIDALVAGQVHQFAANFAGHLGLVASTTIKDYILEARKKLNILKVPPAGRNLVVTPETETAMLSLSEFLTADKVGDDGTALREASIGRILGFNVWMAQQEPNVVYADVVTGDTVIGAHIIGDTSIVIDDAASTVVVGSFVKIAGDETPQLVTAVALNSPVGDSTLTISPGLNRATSAGAAFTAYQPGAVDNAANYAAGWGKFIHVDAFAVDAPQEGQILQFGDSATTIDPTDPVYTIIEVVQNGPAGDYDILLDRPLELALTDNWLVAVGPSGEYNFAFERMAVALVTRPLPLPRSGVGVEAAVVNFNGLSIRVTMSYDAKAQGHLVTADLLCGVKVLDEDRGVAMYG